MFVQNVKKPHSGPLEDKQQKTGEHIENQNNSLDTKINFMFYKDSPVFCVEITILADIREVKKIYVVISVKS